MNKADTFLKLANSLSKYRRAELKNENDKNIIEELYVDPLDNDLILKSMLQDSTTLLIGRKGTGKSTIINRFQHEIRKTDDKLSLYIDVKALFEQAHKSSFPSVKRLDALSQDDLERLNLYKNFIQKVILELKREIKNNIFKNSIIKFFIGSGLTKKEFEQRLDVLFNNVEQSDFQDITAIQKSKENNNQKNVQEASGNIKASLSLANSSIEGNISEDSKNENISSTEFTKILSRYFNIIDFMNQLKELLLELPIKSVFICLDDMSEIDKKSMEVFSDFIVAPLNNLSDEYFKFKISLYPSRVFLQAIDKGKVRTINLDYYDLYSSGNIHKIEESAIKYTKKLIDKRFYYYYGDEVKFNDFFNLSSTIHMDDYFKLLFQISSNVPRIMGKILDIALQKTNSLEKKITKSILEESAKQHYIDDIEYVLTKSEYIEYKSYDESFEQYHLLELLNRLIDKAISNKKHIGSSSAKIFERYSTNTAPSNYLYLIEENERILKTLEFNFFITKYSKQKDKDGKDISIFSLNYGLCMKNNIIFDKESDRKFRIERIFDFNKLINDWMNNSKELICTKCLVKYPLEQKDAFIKFSIPCIKCQGKVKLRPLITTIQKEKIQNTIKIPEKEFEILNALNSKTELRAKELGDDLNRTHQSITHSISGQNSKIKKYNLIDRIEKKRTPFFKLSANGKLFVNEGKLK